MNLFCTCTNTEPCFANGLLLAYSIPYEHMRLADVWLCDDCFEHHLVDNYNIRAVTERHWLVEVELLADEVEQ